MVIPIAWTRPSMPRKQKRSRSLSKRRSRSRSKKARGSASLKRRVTQIVKGNQETKFFEASYENKALYHNIGFSDVLPAGDFDGTSVDFFNPWADLLKGTGRANRIGDEITPVGLSLSIWLANKQDRPNLMYRVIVARVPKAVEGVPTNYISLKYWQIEDQGQLGNKMIRAIDKDRGIKTLYDKVFTLNYGTQGKEYHKKMKLWLSRKTQRKVIFENGNTGTIVNNPLVLLIIPYDSYGTLITDNVASCAFRYRLYFKDA